MRYLMLAIAGLALAPAVSEGHTDPGEVTAVSILPGAGRALVVIDVRGSVGVQDFTLRDPDRLVIDVTGARLRTPHVTYDGRNRGGVVNMRFAQFRPDVVRIVLEMDELKDYQVEYADDAIRITFGADRTFAAWSSTAPAEFAAATQASVRRASPPPPPAPSPTLAQAVQSQQPLVTASYDSAPIDDVMAGFAALSGKSIILGSNVRGFVTAEVRNQPWDIAFEAILEAQGLAAREDQNRPGIIRVNDKATIARLDSIEPLDTRIVRVNYARAADLVPTLASVVSSRGRVVADVGTNSIIITDVVSRIERDSVFVSRLDLQTPQVSIQAKLIFVNRTNVEELGVKYDLSGPDAFFNQVVQKRDPSAPPVPIDTDGDGVPDAFGPGGEFLDENTTFVRLGGNALAAVANADQNLASKALSLLFTTAIGNFTLTSFIDALQQVELADLQAEPLTATSDNTQARVLVGDRVPIRILEAGAQQAEARATVQFEETGIRLEVTPHVTNNRQVLMDVRAENSSVQAAPSDIGFTFSTQEAVSKILVNDGQTAVIGGLTVTEVSVAKTGIPFLVDLPVIGGLFGFTSRRESRRDLLILVTPHIIDNPADFSAGRQ